MLTTPSSGMRALTCLAVVLLTATAAAAADFDTVFLGGQVLDGSGSPPVRADVGVRDGRIAALGDLAGADADRVLAATGLTIVPGFIDLHSHADGGSDSNSLRSRDPKRRAAPNLVTQGVTTVVVNQDGRSPLDIGRQRGQLDERGFGPNVMLMVGHNTIRRAAMTGSSIQRPASEDELATMRRMLRAGLDAGAWGLSAGLEYVPGIWSDTIELIALVKEIVPYGGVYIVHERSSGTDPMWYSPSRDEPNPPTMLDSVLETIRIGEETGAVVVATHIKARGANYWGKSAEMVEAIRAARGRGVRIYADQYPYTSSGSDGTIVLIPRWIFESYPGDSSDFVGALMHALAGGAADGPLAADVNHMIMRRGGPANIIIIRHPDRGLIGKTLAEAAQARGITPVEMVYLLQFKGYQDRFGGAVLRGFSMSERDVRTFAAQPWVATASDAGIALPADGLIHARYYGTFPRKIRRYALDEHVLSVEQAIRSMTTLPAEIMGLRDRGRIEVGYRADIAALDLETLRDTATFFNPHQYPEGVPYVMINGSLVVDRSIPTYELPGQVLTRPISGARLDTDD